MKILKSQLFIIFPISAVLFYENYIIIANCLNVLSAILSVSMWIPQLITTWTEKKAGSLSLISLGCHAMGCLLVIIFQINEKQIFSTILPYIIALICESWLVFYCIYNKRKKQEIPLISDDILYNN